MSLPQIEEAAGNYHFTWQEEQLKVTVSRLAQHKDGRVTGEILITTTAPGYSPHLHQAQFNFSSTQSRAQLAKLMAERYEEADWAGILEQLSYYTLERARRGEPVKTIKTSDEISPPDYLLWPIIPLHQPTILYGDGGVGKSYLALFFAFCLSLPWPDNPLNLGTKNEPTRVLYLDYETDDKEIAWRTRSLGMGMGLPNVSIDYRRCAIPFADDVEQIRQAVQQVGADLIIVDSIGAACAGDLNAAETAIRLFSALRQLNLTSLLISHTSKDHVTKKKTIFGSVYFHTYSRSVWEVKKFQEIGEDEIAIGLFHRKSNLSKLHYPIGATISFQEKGIVIKSQDVRSVAEFLEALSASARIEELLKSGPMSVAEIAEELEIPKDTTRVCLNRMKGRNKVAKIGDKWGLLRTET